MITPRNFAYLISTLNAETIEALVDSTFFQEDYILLEAHTFNVGCYATIESVPYSEELADEANSRGNLFCDTDDFSRLCEETGALEL